MQLLLGQAQWGLLHRDKSIYEDSLGQANLLIQTYYLAQDAATTGVVRELTALTNTVITPNMPDLEPIIRQLEQTTVNNAPQQGR